VRFFKNISSVLLALILAVLVWIVAVSEQNPPRQDDYNQDIPIEIIPPAAGLIATGPLAETVRVRLLAPDSSWQSLTSSKFKATIDLSELEAGFNGVPIQIDISDPEVEIVEQTPKEVSVNLEAVQTISIPIEIEVLDSPPLGYFNRLPIADPAAVHITGPASVIGQVDKAVSEVFIRNSKETLEIMRHVIVRNREDQIIRGIEVEPPKVQILLPIEQRFGYKDVSVRVRVQGQVASGYRVSNISVDPPTLTIVGNPGGLSEITGLVETTPINLTEATEDIVRIVSLNLPDGVTTVLSESEADGPGGVQVTVEVTPIEDGITLQRPLNQQGLGANQWWRVLPNRIDVFLSGPLTQLQMLRASDVEVIVDLFGLDPGIHKLQPTVFRPDALRVDAILPDTIEVTIGRTVQRPIVQQELDSSYSWTPSPNRMNVNLFGSPERLQALNPNDIKVIVDLAELEPGFHRVRPIVSLPDGVELDSISPDTVDITIQLKSPPTITPVVTITETISAALTTTETISATLTPPAAKIATPQLAKDN
jgi:YbbR domain-containing protein